MLNGVSKFHVMQPVVFGERMVQFHKLQGVFLGGRQRNMWTEQARQLAYQRKHQVKWTAGVHILNVSEGKIRNIWKKFCFTKSAG